jgi:hypothetical protein
MFPIGLGLKVLFGSAILTVLSFGLLLPTFGHFTKKGLWSFLFNALLAFLKAHYELVMNQEGKIEQLLYLYNADTDKASWATYDVNLDSWTKEYLGENPKPAKDFQTPLFSKYNLVSLMPLALQKKNFKTHCRILKRQYCRKQKVFEN